MCKKLVNGIYIKSYDDLETFLSINNLKSLSVDNTKLYYNDMVYINLEDIKFINIRYNDDSICINLKAVIKSIIAKLNNHNAKIDIKVE